MSIKTVLVDDHKTFLEQTSQQLDKEHNIEVVGTAGNGKEAVNLALKLHPDVVVMDISMPEMNGIDATKEIRKKVPHTKVLCFTVHSEKFFLRAMLRAGAIGYILKDCPFEELVGAISSVYERKMYVSHQLARYVSDVNQ